LALWKSDGTQAGTEIVKRFDKPTSGSEFSWQLVDVNGVLFFRAWSGNTGFALWKSDGTESGTVMVKDINPGLEGLPISHLTDLRGTLILAADDGEHGMSIWTSDGTEGGTIRIKDITVNGDRFVIPPPRFTVLGDSVFFSGNDGIHGNEVWKSDRTEAGTSLVADFFAGSDGLGPGFITNADGTLYFSGDDRIHGREPFVLRAFANTPSVTHTVTLVGLQSQTGLAVTRNGVDGGEVSHVKVTEISHGTLFLHDGVAEVSAGEFVPFDEAARGFKFTPAEGFVGMASFEVQASTSASDEGLGGEVVTATITVLPGLGTAGDDSLTLRASSNGMMLDVYNGNPPGPGATPIFTWPMDASAALPIDTLAGDDVVVVELPAGTSGPGAGIRLEAGAGVNQLLVKSGSVRIDAVATGGTLDSSVADGAQILTSRLNQNALAIGDGGKVTILPGGAQASVITSLEFLTMLGAAPEEPASKAKDEGRRTKDEGRSTRHRGRAACEG
jgi:ELWxxDGT repeat protein